MNPRRLKKRKSSTYTKPTATKTAAYRVAACREAVFEMGAEASSDKGKEIDISALPEELLFHVLMFVPAVDVVKRCSLVCKHWWTVSKNQLLWRRRCEQEGKYIPGVMGPPPHDFRVFYFKNPYTRNLLRNTHAAENYWYTPGDFPSVSVETSPNGAYPIADCIPAEEIQGKPVQNWVTSYRFRAITQQVDLLKEGCSKEVLDDLRPPIYASAWCTARQDCGAKFKLVVKLLDQEGRTVLSVKKKLNMDAEAMRQVWHKVETTFTDYKPGVRSVKFQMGGVDTKFWAGNYGAKFTLPCLRFMVSKRGKRK